MNVEQLYQIFVMQYVCVLQNHGTNVSMVTWKKIVVPAAAVACQTIKSIKNFIHKCVSGICNFEIMFRSFSLDNKTLSQIGKGKQS